MKTDQIYLFKLSVHICKTARSHSRHRHKHTRE